jgi:hypothetical protein
MKGEEFIKRPNLPKRKYPFAHVGAKIVHEVASVSAKPFCPNLSLAAHRLLKMEKSLASASKAWFAGK